MITLRFPLQTSVASVLELDFRQRKNPQSLAIGIKVTQTRPRPVLIAQHWLHNSKRGVICSANGGGLVVTQLRTTKLLIVLQPSRITLLVNLGQMASHREPLQLAPKLHRDPLPLAPQLHLRATALVLLLSAVAPMNSKRVGAMLNCISNVVGALKHKQTVRTAWARGVLLTDLEAH